MTLTRESLLNRYGEAAVSGNASLLVGAGLSRARGLPSWDELLAPLRRQARIPSGEGDLPLVAQYFTQSVPGGRDVLLNRMGSQLSKTTPSPGEGHKALARLPIRTFWTTNYDTLLEQTLPEASVIAKDDQLRDRALNVSRIVKLHGSLRNGQWEASPVITRSDYELYERQHPRMWHSLQATYLTQAMLFLGFSFDDPNIELLLRLARTTLELGAPEHFTVLRRPTKPEQQMAHKHRVRDLEQSGVAVYEIDAYEELNPLLTDMVRRTRPPILFIVGSESDTDAALLKACCEALAHNLSDLDITMSSLSGQAAKTVKYTMGDRLIREKKYDPRKLVFNYRRPGPEDSSRPPSIERRIGTIVFSNVEDKYILRRNLIDECRAVVVLGGGANSDLEVDIATELKVPIIPMACSGGAAARAYAKGRGEWVPDESDWALLNVHDAQIAAPAASRLIKLAMHLKPS